MNHEFITVQSLYNKDSPVFRNMCHSSCSITPGLYAMVGEAASLGGVTRMTGMLQCSPFLAHLIHRLMVSFCDPMMSVVYRPSSVNN